MKPQSFRGYAGLRNDVPEERYTKADLSSATNVDLDETGRVYRRFGYSLLAAKASAHSLFALGRLACYAAGTQLYRLDLADFSGASVATGLTAGAPLTYVGVNGAVYWGNGYQSGVLTPSVGRSFGLTPPAVPALFETPGGFPAGRYGVTATYVRDDGQESGAPQIKVITLPANSGISVTVEASSDPTVVRKNVYMTGPDGEVAFFAGTLANGSGAAVYTQPTLGVVPLITLAKTPLPPARVLAYYNGRVYGASGAHLYYSDPYNFELMDPRQNVVSFDSQVNVVAPVLDGLFVGTDTATYFLSGADPSDFVRRAVAPYGAVWGKAVQVPGEFVSKDRETRRAGNVVLWMSKKGPCYGTDGGEFKNMTSDRLIRPDATYSANLFRASSGTYHFVSSVFN